MNRLDQKTAVITGCNRGIGKAILEKFVSEGANIVACTRKIDDALLSYYANLEQQNHVSIYPIRMDFVDVESIKQALKSIKEMKMPIDILVNNAGVAKFSSFLFTRMDDVKNMMQVNLFAPMQITQSIITLMVKNKKGSIINISSISGMDMMVGNSAYGASKAAINSWTRTLSAEMGRVGIRVNAIAPSFVETDILIQTAEGIKEQFLTQSSLKRLATPEEIANTALFLASDEASYVTGQIIRVDGGM